MTNEFYYIGLLYILFQFYQLYGQIFGSSEEYKNTLKNISNEVSSISEINTETAKNTIGIAKNFAFKNIIVLILAMSFLVWIIIGCYYAEESKMFIAVLFTHILLFLTPIITAAISTVREATNGKDVISSVLDNAKNIADVEMNIFIGTIESAIKIAAIGFITYNHFCIV